MTDELMFEIRRLSGQVYVDRYAKRHGVVGGSEVAEVDRTGGRCRTPVDRRRPADTSESAA